MSSRKPRRPEPPTAIAVEADRLETALQRALYGGDPRDVAVIGAAALEVSELAYWLANGWGGHLLWVAAHDG